MKVVEIQFNPWDKGYYFDPGDHELVEGDFVVVKTQLGVEIGKVIDFKEVISQAGIEIKPLMRKATTEDLHKVQEREAEKDKAVDYCKQMIDKHQLSMKLVDVHFSFDGGRVTFAFIADGRVDFRELVKDLTRRFQKSIRLQQLGIRDEARIAGDVGSCGQPLCCRTFLKDLVSVTSDLAETQQVAHRGSERLAGSCGRLRCCLAFEQEGYEELAHNLPPVGSRVKTKNGSGQVIAWHTLRQSVRVKLDDETIIEVPFRQSNK